MKVNSISCRHSFTQTLLEVAQTDRDVVAVTSDARGSVTLDKFAAALPEQFVEVGIAEQNAVGIAAGLSSAGKKVFVCGPACFYVARSLEQIKVDVAYSKNPVKIVGVSGGVAYGALGTTHHSLHDLAVLRTFPDLHIVLPCDVRQTRILTRQLVDYSVPVYMRMGRNAVPDVYEKDRDFPIGGSYELLSGNDLTIIGAGETVYYCLEAGRRLQAEGIEARVIDMYSIKPIDRQAIIRAAEQTDMILTVEEHSLYGGLGAAVAEITAQNRPVPMKLLGIPDEHAVHGNAREIFRHYGMDTDGIYKAAKELFTKHTNPVSDYERAHHRDRSEHLGNEGNFVRQPLPSAEPREYRS